MRPGFVSHHPTFEAVTGDRPQLVLVAECDAHEGPVYVAGEDALYFTSTPEAGRHGPRTAIRRIALDGDSGPIGRSAITTLTAPTVMANGMAADHAGRLVVCEQGDRRHPGCLSRIDLATGEREVLADGWRGRPFNSPNDATVGPDGSIWFTDPSYGHLQGFRPPPELGDFVYRWDPASGLAEVVADGFDKPNGIAWSPDGSTLYVADSGAIQKPRTFIPTRPHHVLSFPVEGDRVGSPRLFAVTAPGFPDGLKVDREGRVFVSSTSGVLVYSAAGRLLGEITVAGAVNFTFGGRDDRVLFITTDHAVWAATLATSGPCARPTQPLMMGANR